MRSIVLCLQYSVRDRIKKNNDRLRQAKTTVQLDGDDVNEPVGNDATDASASEGDEKTKDQGFTKPLALLVAPFRAVAVDILHTLCWFMSLADDAQGGGLKREHIIGYDRFEEDFIDNSAPPPSKPLDHRVTFSGNMDDAFAIGIKVMRKKLKLFHSPHHLHEADLILASPLGLRLQDQKRKPATTNQETTEDETSAQRPSPRVSFDYLSSVDVIACLGVDIMLMQNWQHLDLLLSACNQLPRQPPAGVDFSRVRMCLLDDLGSSFRQLIVTSAYPDPEIQAFFHQHGKSYHGRLKMNLRVVKGIMEKLPVNLGSQVRLPLTFIKLVLIVYCSFLDIYPSA